MQGQSYQVKAVLEQWDAWNNTFLVFKDSPRNPLGSLPLIEAHMQPLFSEILCERCLTLLIRGSAF